MTVAVFLDSNVWNFLFDRQLDLATELPAGEFSIGITREVELEIAAIPDAKHELKEFVRATIDRCAICTDILFGFAEAGMSQAEQRFGGFGVGRFANAQEIAFSSKQGAAQVSTQQRPSKLNQNEADISLGARSLHSVVLTLDRTGPLKDALVQGGRVVYLTDFDSSGLSLRRFIRTKLGQT